MLPTPALIFQALPEEKRGPFMGFTVPHRHQTSTWLSRGKCKRPNRHEEQARRLADSILLGNDYAIAAGLIAELISPDMPLAWWRVMDCGCMFAASPFPLHEQNGQGVEERTGWRRFLAYELEDEPARVLPLDGSVTHNPHHRSGPDPSGPTEQRRAS